MRRVPDVGLGLDRPPPPRWVAYAFRPDCISGLLSPDLWSRAGHAVVLGSPRSRASVLHDFFKNPFVNSRRSGGQGIQEQAEILQLFGLELGQAGRQGIRQRKEPLEGDDA